MFRKISFVGALCSSALILSACGGGGTSENGAGIPEGFATLTNITNTTDSELIGTGVKLDNAISTVEISGTLYHRSGAIRVTDNDGVVLYDPTGIYVDEDGTEYFYDGNRVQAIVEVVNSSYDYVTPYFVVYRDIAYIGDFDNSIWGVVGIGAEQSSMPTSGTASYSGDTYVDVYNSSTANEVFQTGTAQVNVDFAGAGDVDITLDNFSSVEFGTDTSTPNLVDQIVISDATISGIALNGGSISTTSGGIDSTSTYANGAFSHAGYFFGPVEGVGPDELGGTFLVYGDNGAIIGMYFAD